MQWPERFKPTEGDSDTEDRRGSQSSNVQTGKDMGSEFFCHISVHR